MNQNTPPTGRADSPLVDVALIAFGGTLAAVATLTGIWNAATVIPLLIVITVLIVRGIRRII